MVCLQMTIPYVSANHALSYSGNTSMKMTNFWNSYHHYFWLSGAIHLRFLEQNFL